MKALVTAIAFFCTFYCQAQEWKEMYVTSKGDTVKPGYFIRLRPGRSYASITPKADDPYSYQMMAKRKAFLDTDMQGKDIKIDRLSRIRRNKKYYHIAVFEISDYHLDPLNTVEYIVNIERALANKEIEIVK